MATPFRHAHLHCPRCGTTELAVGRLQTCGRCQGTWISEHDLAERVGVMQPEAARVIEWSIAQRRSLPCVTCAAPMQPLVLYDVPIDLCRAHGVWFDAGELEQALLRAHVPAGAQPATPGEPNPGTLAVGDGTAGEAVFEVVFEVLAVVLSAIDL